MNSCTDNLKITRNWTNVKFCMWMSSAITQTQVSMTGIQEGQHRNSVISPHMPRLSTQFSDFICRMRVSVSKAFLKISYLWCTMWLCERQDIAYILPVCRKFPCNILKNVRMQSTTKVFLSEDERFLCILQLKNEFNFKNEKIS